MSDKDHAQKNDIAKAVEHLVKPGESWIVRKGEDAEVEVSRETTSSLATTHPDLYGRLLKISEQLSSAGGSFIIWGILAVVVMCVGLHLHWFDSLLGEFVENIRSIWFYLVATVVAFLASVELAQLKERGMYRRCRESILQDVKAAGISPHGLITLVEGDDALSDLADHLKKDKDSMSGGGGGF
jgi:hypothetical protein